MLCAFCPAFCLHELNVSNPAPQRHLRARFLNSPATQLWRTPPTPYAASAARTAVTPPSSPPPTTHVACYVFCVYLEPIFPSPTKHQRVFRIHFPAPLQFFLSQTKHHDRLFPTSKVIEQMLRFILPTFFFFFFFDKLLECSCLGCVAAVLCKSPLFIVGVT